MSSPPLRAPSSSSSSSLRSISSGQSSSSSSCGSVKAGIFGFPVDDVTRVGRCGGGGGDSWKSLAKESSMNLEEATE